MRRSSSLPSTKTMRCRWQRSRRAAQRSPSRRCWPNASGVAASSCTDVVARGPTGANASAPARTYEPQLVSLKQIESDRVKPHQQSGATLLASLDGGVPRRQPAVIKPMHRRQRSLVQRQQMSARARRVGRSSGRAASCDCWSLWRVDRNRSLTVVTSHRSSSAISSPSSTLSLFFLPPLVHRRRAATDALVGANRERSSCSLLTCTPRFDHG